MYKRQLPRVLTLMVIPVLASLMMACATEDSDGPVAEEATDDPVNGEADGEVAEPVTLQFGTWLSEGTSFGQSVIWWAEEVSNRTDGRITVEFFWNATLVGTDEIVPAMQDERIELGHVVTAYYPGVFPLSDIKTIPFMSDNTGAVMLAFQQLAETDEQFQKEWENNGLKYMVLVGSGPSVVGSVEPIASLEDMAGKDVRTIPGIDNAFNAIGANPVTLGTDEVYEAMQRGLVDMYAAIPLDVVTPLSLEEVGPHIIDTSIGNYAGVNLAMSLAAWNSLSASDQSTILEVNAEFPQHHANVVAMGEDASCETILQAGGTVNTLSDADVEAWREAIGDAPEGRWMTNAVDAGNQQEDVEQFLELWTSLLADAENEWGEYETGMSRCAQR